MLETVNVAYEHDFNKSLRIWIEIPAALSASFVIGQRDYFGFGFKELD